MPVVSLDQDDLAGTDVAGLAAELDFAKAPGFVINGLKREELIASNSMILHELFFASLGDEGAPEGELRDALVRDFGSVDRWRSEFSAMGKALRSINDASDERD